MVPTKTVGLKSLHLQESRVHYILAGMKSLLKIGEGGFLGARGGVPEPLEPSPGYAPALVLFLALTKGSVSVIQ